MKMSETQEGRAYVVPDGVEARRLAGEAVARGGVVAFRTDTFYGLGANPLDSRAVRAVNELKGREDKPILLVLSDAAESARVLGGRSELFETLAARHWPGPLTLVAAARAGLPRELTAGGATIGVRLPDDEVVRALVRACGGALTATSANRAGEPPARSAAEVLQAFPRGIALIIDGGETSAARPSTVVDVSSGELRLVREGALSWREVQATYEEFKRAKKNRA